MTPGADSKADPDSDRRLTPFFLDGPAGPVFALYHRPVADAHHGDVLFCPPFAEELNRSRRMVTLLGQALARRGHGLLVLDPYGTGDSGGEFVDARWETWCGDVEAAIDWLGAGDARPLSLLGLRLGALLAMTVAANHADRIARVMLWAPVAKGDVMLTQFLRTRIAAQMTADKDADAPKETTKSLRETLAAGTPIEVAGYMLAPALVAAIDRLALAPQGSRVAVPIDWFELIGEAGRPLPPVAKRVIDGWVGEGVDVTSHPVVGEAFWAMLETTVAPELVAATVDAIAGGGS